ncbi:addiction module protein [Hyalangium versicolor]|uniref:addiction module protein n=1 Tax=Hyalangium versicolor TaxID=2861190 RepID=UPI001CC97093|nr:addiction module protein [Hyalangium versicolor]
MANADDLLTDALQLPVEERVRLVHKLLVSLEDEEAHLDADRAWAQEVEQRAHDVLSGAVETEDAEAVLDRISARLRNGHR